jgi:hypothetical protein
VELLFELLDLARFIRYLPPRHFGQIVQRLDLLPQLLQLRVDLLAFDATVVIRSRHCVSFGCNVLLRRDELCEPLLCRYFVALQSPHLLPQLLQLRVDLLPATFGLSNQCLGLLCSRYACLGNPLVRSLASSLIRQPIRQLDILPHSRIQPFPQILHRLRLAVARLWLLDASAVSQMRIFEPVWEFDRPSSDRVAL